MTNSTRRMLSLALVFAALVLGACGGEPAGESGQETGPTGSGQARQGGEVTIAQASQPDSLDPALSYDTGVWQALWLVYTPLLTYRHAEGTAGTQLIPGLAEQLPEISDDGLTYTLALRDGLRYSDGTPVRASDFEHTIQRVLNLESGGTTAFLVIEGAEEYVEAGEAEADISGIETNDRTGEITIRLTAPDATFKNVLAMNFAGLVPGDTPFRDLTEDPPPGVGPYVLSESLPNRQYVLEKNPRFPDIPGIPKGHLDRITTRIVKNLTRQAQDVIRGDLDYMEDPPPADLLPEIRERYPERYAEETTTSSYYFFMNHRVAPFDDARVRQAVNLAVDKPALARVYGGLMEPTCTFLPPAIPGHVARGADCPWGDPNRPPNLERARALLREAGAEGEQVTVYGNNEVTAQRATEAYADMLNELGLDAEVEILDGAIYFQTIGSQRTRAQTGFANWFGDFPHPANFLFLHSGRTIQETNNPNFGNVDDPQINRAIARLTRVEDLGAVADEWAQVDHRLIDEGHIVPWGHRRLTTFMSERMDFENCRVYHPLYYDDYSQWCLKEGS